MYNTTMLTSYDVYAAFYALGPNKRYFCLTSDVCLSRISGLTREQRGLRRPKLAQR